jgi:hypothetical protein
LGPFLDPVTKEKVHLINHAKDDDKEANQDSKKHALKAGSITDYVDHDQLLKDYGGCHDFEWDFKVYWGHLHK